MQTPARRALVAIAEQAARQADELYKASVKADAHGLYAAATDLLELADEFRARAIRCATRATQLRDPDAPTLALPPGPTKALMTVQVYTDNGDITHLVRSCGRDGTPGPLLCGLNHHAPGIGFSVGGGISGPEYVVRPCYACCRVAKHDWPGLPVTGLHHDIMAMHVTRAGWHPICKKAGCYQAGRRRNHCSNEHGPGYCELAHSKIDRLDAYHPPNDLHG